MPKHSSIITPARVLLPIGLGTALSLMGDATLYTVLPTHTLDVGITLTQVGIMLGINRAIRLLSNGLAGYAYDRMPRRPIFLPALFIGAFSTTLYAISRGFWTLLVGRLLWGIAWSGIWVGGTTMILDVTAEQERGKWSGLYQIWFFTGTALGALTGGFLTDYLGYYTTMWVCALITCIGAMIALILLPETRPVLVSGVLKNAREIHLGVDTSLGSPLYHALHSSPFRRKSDAYRFAFVVGLRGVNRFIIAGILSATLSLLVRDYLSGKGLAIGIATLTGVLMASRTVMSILGAYIAGFISDFLRNRWGVLMSGIALSVMSMVFLSSRFSVIIVLGIAMIALARGSMQSMTTSLTGDLTSVSHRGKAVGLLHTVGDLGSAIGPPVAFYLFPLWGLSHVYLLCAGIFGLSLVVNLVLLRFTDVEKVSDH